MVVVWMILFGADGRLGTFIRKANPGIMAFGKKEADITDMSAVMRVVKTESPKYIINCAAITDVEYCESHPAECWRVNVDGVRNLVHAAGETGCKLVHFSSNYALDPVNEYGRSKKESEKIAAHHIVIRTDMYDAKTFIVNTLLSTRDVLNAFDDRFFNPVYMGTVAGLVDGLKDRTGIINVGTNERLSMYEFAMKICEVFGVRKSRVNPVASPETAGSVKRPKELYLKPDVDISIMDDLRRFKNELEKQESVDSFAASG